MNKRYHVEGTMPDATRAPEGAAPFYVFDRFDQTYLPMVFTARDRAEVMAHVMNAEEEAVNPPERLMCCTVELLIPVTGTKGPNEATDAVSALLTDFAEGKGVIRDWRYALGSDGQYCYPVEADVEAWADGHG